LSYFVSSKNGLSWFHYSEEGKDGWHYSLFPGMLKNTRFIRVDYLLFFDPSVKIQIHSSDNGKTKYHSQNTTMQFVF